MNDIIIEAQLHQEELLRKAKLANEKARLLRQACPQKGTRFYYAALAWAGCKFAEWGSRLEKRYTVVEKPCCPVQPVELGNSTA